MEEKVINNTLVSPEEGRQVNNVVEHVSEKTLIGITGDLSSEDKEFCEKNRLWICCHQSSLLVSFQKNYI